MIKAEVRYQSEHIKALFELEDKKRKPKRIAALIFVFLVCAFYTGIIVLSYIVTHRLDGMMTFAAAVTIFMWFLFIRRILQNRRIIKEMNTMPPVRELRRFTFDSIMFRMVCAREGFYLDQQIHYSELFSVCETDKFFFITIEKGKTCIIGKHELIEGTPEELRALLMDKLRDKYTMEAR